MTLTTRQREVLRFLSRECRHGRCPTVREIRDHFRLSSTNGVARHLLALEKKGFIKRRRGTARGVRIVGQAGRSDARTIEQQLLSALEQCVAFIDRIQKDDLPTIQEYREVMDVSYAAINAAGEEA